MKLSFHGAARTVTGSKHLLELHDGINILMDCGMFQGNPREADELNRDFGFDPAKIHFLLLSHAHIDHSGLIPKLIRAGFTGKIFCTPATFELSKILLLDSAHIHESDTRYHNKIRSRKGQRLLSPLYTIADAENSFRFFHQVGYHEIVQLTPHCSFQFTDVGHIIGSAAINLTIRENNRTVRLAFSGDVGRYNDALLKAPEYFPQCDYLILESTYGSSLHDDVEMNDRNLLKIILDTCLRKKGRLVIPAFSVGRTQELIYALNRLEITKHLPNIDFYVDSPLSVKATDMLKSFQDNLNQNFQEFRKLDNEPFDFESLHYITDVEDSKALNFKKNPCVIISASGMADAGRVKHHIKHIIEDERNTILLAGYCEPNSLGGKLMRGNKDVTIYGESFRVNAEVKTMLSLSSHADYDDLCKFVSCQDISAIKKLFLVHGEYEVQQTFRSKLLKKGFVDVEIPSLHQMVHL